MADLLESRVPTAAAAGMIASGQQQREIALVQAQMLMARSMPRDAVAARDRVIDACRSPEVAEAALYSFAKGGTDISGPSIKLIQAIAREWGNIHSGLKIQRGDGFSECVAYAYDLQTGYYDSREFTVRHWRDTRQGGYQLKDERDIYELEANMGQRRKRAVLETVLPADIVAAAVRQCEETLTTTADTSPAAVKRMVAAFAEFGVTPQAIEQRIQRRTDAIQPAQMVALKKIYASLRDGMSAPADWFAPPVTVETNTEAPTQRVKDKMREHRREATEAAAPKAPATDAPHVDAMAIRDYIEHAINVDQVNSALDLTNAIGDREEAAALAKLAQEKIEKLAR